MPSTLLRRTAGSLLAMLLHLPLAAQEKPARAGGHLFILSGQSNMTGGLEAGFRATVTKALGADQVTIVRSMKSGRGIRFWVKDYALPEDHELAGKLKTDNGEEYPRLLEAVKQAGDARAFASVSLIWMQGESDANRKLGVVYEKSFTRLLGRLKADLGLERMHVVIGRISDHGLDGERAAGWTQMRQAQERLAQADPLTVWIDTDDLNGGDASRPRGELHYPAAQSPKLGERFGQAALKLLAARQPK